MSETETGLSCVHGTGGLCESCREEFDADSSAFWEFGSHPAGIARWRAMRAEMDADREREGPPRQLTAEEEAEIPF